MNGKGRKGSGGTGRRQERQLNGGGGDGKGRGGVGKGLVPPNDLSARRPCSQVNINTCSVVSQVANKLAQ